VAQLKSQSPLNPLDPNQFVAQLATFNSLSELTQIRQILQKIATLKGVPHAYIFNTALRTDSQFDRAFNHRQQPREPHTVGYKDARVLFRDLFYQTIGSNGAGNAIQQGAGTAVGSIPASFVQGNVDPSGVSTDVAILGDGFFVVSKNGVVSYTRAGDFSVDKTSLLVTSDGQQVLGYPPSTA